MINTLIDKQDNFEIIRDQIAAILKLNTANQQTLASAAGKDPAQWDLRVFLERSNPWEEFQNADGPKPPIVNVWFDSSDNDDRASDTVERQKYTGVYNIDIYTCGTSVETAEGHSPGDMDAALNLHRAVRLVRNIIMADIYAYLGFPRGKDQFVWGGRKVAAINIFQPAADDATAQNIMGARIVFRVPFNEASPQVEPVPLEFLSIQVKRAENGEILLITEYDYGS